MSGRNPFSAQSRRAALLLLPLIALMPVAPALARDKAPAHTATAGKSGGAAAAAKSAQAAAPQERSIGLPGTTCRLPDAIASTTAHVLYRYLLRGGRKAKMIHSVYLVVDPEANREAFVKATTACLEAHPSSGAIPDPSTDVRYQAFHYVHRTDPWAPRVRLSRTRSLPKVWTDELHEQKILLAKQLLAEPLFREMERPGVRVWSNAGGTEFREIGEGIDATLRAFDVAFPGARPVPEGEDALLLVFRDEDGYERMAAFSSLSGPNDPHPVHYREWDPIVSTAAPHDTPFRWLAGYLARDLARHLVLQRLRPEGATLPYWAVEGLSTFFGCLKWPAPGHEVDLSAIERQQEVRGMFKYRQPGGLMLEQVARLEEHGSFPSFGDLPEDSPFSVMSGGQIEITLELPRGIEPMHSPSWIAVHFLMNADDGKYRAAFRKWIEDPDKEKTSETLSEALGRPIPFLDQDLAGYIKATW